MMRQLPAVCLLHPLQPRNPDSIQASVERGDVWLNQFEKIELHKSGTGEKTDIDNIDAVFAWWP